MKKLLLIFLLIANFAYAEDKIVYLDMNILLNESKVGKFINNELKKINDKNNEEFKKIEDKIKSEDQNLAKQKNILKEEEYILKASQLRSQYNDFQDLVKNKNLELNKIKANAGNKILVSINEVLSDYSKNNSIAIILDKNKIVIGKNNLDITSDILSLLNKKVSKIELK